MGQATAAKNAKTAARAPAPPPRRAAATLAAPRPAARSSEPSEAAEREARQVARRVVGMSLPAAAAGATRRPPWRSPHGSRFDPSVCGRTPQRQVAGPASPVAVEESAPRRVQRFGLGDVLGAFARRAHFIPGFRLLTLALGANPLDGSPAERSPAALLRALVELLPGGALIAEALARYGLLERVGTWAARHLAALGVEAGAIRGSIDHFLDSLDLGDLANPGALWERARQLVAEPAARVLGLLGSAASAILLFLKEAILRPLGALAAQTSGYGLLKAVLGFDPVTGEAVPQTPDALIGGFLELIGQDELWQNLQRANAIPRAFAWFKSALAGLLGFVARIPALFLQAFATLALADVVLLPRAFAKVAAVFGGFLGQFAAWAGATIWSLLEILFEVLAPGVLPYLRKAAGAFRTILQNPVAFVGNLVRAGKLGFQQFAGRFLQHLRAGLIGWLTGAMAGAGLYVPQSFEAREILKFVLSGLGVSWQNVRAKLVKAVGETTVKAMEIGFDLVKTLVTQGPAAAWQQILESLTNLKDMVIEQILAFVKERIVSAAVTKLLSMLSPAGAFLQAIVATYNTVMFWVERLQQIAQVAAAYIDSIAAIAAGSITTAADRVEKTMAGTLTLVISFLARLAGLGRVTDAVTRVLDRARARVDAALDRVVAWVVAQAKRLGKFLAGKVAGKDARTPEEKQRELDRIVRELKPKVEKLLKRGLPKQLLLARLAIWRVQYRLTSLSIEGGQVRAAINPTADMYTAHQIEIGELLEPILRRAELTFLRRKAGESGNKRMLRQAERDLASGVALTSPTTSLQRVLVLRGLRRGKVPTNLRFRGEYREPPGPGNPDWSTLTKEMARDLTKDQLTGLEKIHDQRIFRSPYHLEAQSFSREPGPRLRAEVLGVGAYDSEHLPPAFGAAPLGNAAAQAARKKRATHGVNKDFAIKNRLDIIRGLRDDYETVRIPGNFAANRVAAAMVETGAISEEEMTYGLMAPAAIKGSDSDQTNPKVRAVRHGAFGVIFLALRNALSGKMLVGEAGAKLLPLVEAFQAWLPSALAIAESRKKKKATEQEEDDYAQSAFEMQKAVRSFLDSWNK